MGDESSAGGVDEFVIFLDENHCRNPQLIRVLVEANIHFESHLRHFAPGLADVEWLPVIARSGWILLTTDARIRRKGRVNALERKTVGESGVRMFYFSTNQSSGAEMAASLRRALPKMKAMCLSEEASFTASISKAGDVTLRDRASDLLGAG